uniref:Protein kinase domain-containing protein n=1 Tax=Oryza punctata TaxID=4537 RepID=A0A0E0JYU8_ORYPU
MMHKNKKLVGENRKVEGKHNYLTEEAKLLFRTILAEVHFLHEDGKCPKKITKSDIFVKNGRAELKGVDLCKKEDTMILQNYKEVYEIIMETVFQQHSNDIPDDVMHTFNEITDYGY